MLEGRAAEPAAGAAWSTFNPVRLTARAYLAMSAFVICASSSRVLTNGS